MAGIELTAAQAEELRASQQAVELLRRELDRLDRAGIGSPDLRRRLEQAEAKRQGMLQHFSPGAVTRTRGR